MLVTEGHNPHLLRVTMFHSVASHRQPEVFSKLIARCCNTR